MMQEKGLKNEFSFIRKNIYIESNGRNKDIYQIQFFFIFLFVGCCFNQNLKKVEIFGIKCIFFYKSLPTIIPTYKIIWAGLRYMARLSNTVLSIYCTIYILYYNVLSNTMQCKKMLSDLQWYIQSNLQSDRSARTKVLVEHIWQRPVILFPKKNVYKTIRF